jgi:hypothetical protein
MKQKNVKNTTDPTKIPPYLSLLGQRGRHSRGDLDRGDDAAGEVEVRERRHHDEVDLELAAACKVDPEDAGCGELEQTPAAASWRSGGAGLATASWGNGGSGGARVSALVGHFIPHLVRTAG